MTSTVTSPDGTTIAYERIGTGPSIVLVAGMLCDRTALAPLAAALSSRYTATTYDRRGRGDSTDTAPYSVEREVEDLAAVVDAVGATVVYGHSSGAALVLEAAARTLSVGHLILHEPPYGDDDEASINSARALDDAVGSALSARQPHQALEIFFTAAGMPPDMISQMCADPATIALAPTMAYDLAITGGSTRGGVVPTALATAIGVPALVLAGDASPEFFQDTARRLGELMPAATHRLLAGQGHDADPAAVTVAVEAFLDGPGGGP